MTEKVFIDTDIVLDLLLGRHPHGTYASKVFALLESGTIQGCVSSLIFANLHYVLRKHLSAVEALSVLQKLKLVVAVLPVNERIVSLALTSGFKDFEDAIQYYAAKEKGIRILLTRNKNDYKNADMIVMSAEEYLKMKQHLPKAKGSAPERKK